MSSAVRELPGHYLVAAARGLGAPGPRSMEQAVLIDAMPFWGRYCVTFAAERTETGNWQWRVGEQRQLEPPVRPYISGLVEVFGRARP